MPFQPILPTWLAVNGANDTSPSYFTDLRTGQPVFAGGLNQGDYFDLTNKEASQLSNTATGTLYCGRYRRVQVDSGATAANIKTGTIGLMGAIAADLGKINIVTSYDKGVPGLHPVVFLNAITPGNYGFVQELGVATVLYKSAGLTNGTPAVGDTVISIATGLVDDPTQSGSITYAIYPTVLGLAIDLPVTAKLLRVQLNLPVAQD